MTLIPIPDHQGRIRDLPVASATQWQAFEKALQCTVKSADADGCRMAINRQMADRIAKHLGPIEQYRVDQPAASHWHPDRPPNTFFVPWAIARQWLDVSGGSNLLAHAFTTLPR